MKIAMKNASQMFSISATTLTLALLGLKMGSAHALFHNPFYDMLAFGMFLITFSWLIIRWVAQPKVSSKPVQTSATPAAELRLEDFVKLTANGFEGATFSGKVIKGSEQTPDMLVLQRLARA